MNEKKNRKPRVSIEPTNVSSPKDHPLGSYFLVGFEDPEVPRKLEALRRDGLSDREALAAVLAEDGES